MSARSLPALMLVAMLARPALRAQDVYVANQGADDVTVFEAAAPAQGVTIPVGDQPHEIAIHPSGRWVLVTNRLDHDVSLLDAATRTEVDLDGNPANGITRIQTGSLPHGIAFSPDGAHVAVTNNASSSVSMISAATWQVVSTVPGLGGFPHMARFSPDGLKLWVVNLGGQDVQVLDAAAAVASPSTALETSIPLGVGISPEGIAFTPDGTLALVALGFGTATVAVIDTATRLVTAFVPVGQSPLRVEVSPDGTRAYTSNISSDDVSVIDLASLTVVHTIPGIVDPVGLTFTQDGATVLAAGFQGTVYVIDVPTNLVTGTIAAGLGSDGIVIQPDLLTRTADLAPGQTGEILIRRPQDFGLAYQAACSLGTSPGIPLGTRTIPLVLDELLLFSITQPAWFVGFAGNLDAEGSAVTSIVVAPSPPLFGLQLFMAVITLDPVAPDGVRTISPALPLEIL